MLDISLQDGLGKCNIPRSRRTSFYDGFLILLDDTGLVASSRRIPLSHGGSPLQWLFFGPYAF